MTSLTTGRLPVQLFPLVGRQHELQDVVDALSRSRLLTLTGPGGTGKTRLALAAADAARVSYPDGVCWVELAPVDNPAVVALAVASALGTRERPGEDVTNTIAEHLSDRSMLIVLDNCEHLAAAAARLAARVLGACPALSILATSREPLGVDGERQLAVPPLALPQVDAAPAAVTLAAFDAVRFFEQRAQLVLPSFTLADDNAGAVHQVCRRLDGLPLAIELAAARLQILSVGQLAERLDNIFTVLVGGARRALGAATVHRGDALVTAADWGYAKPRELLFLLVSSPPMTREQLGAALWPDQSGGRLGNALHTALRGVRRALGDPGWVLYSDGHYTFNSSRQHDCDVETFEQALAAARRAQPAAAALPDLQRAVAAYGGDFLADMTAGEWAQARRDELRRAFEAALLAMGRLLAASGRYQPAVTAFRRAVAHEPLNETAHRELMSSWARLGETARAIRHYRELVDLLREQVGVPPAAETTTLYQRLQDER